VVLCRGATIEVEELPQAVRSGRHEPLPASELSPEGIDFRQAVSSYQERLIREALRRTDGVQRQAARLLKLSPTTLNEMVHRLGIETPEDGGHD
jgi:DNA-binding NtrC family response regulator